MVLGGEGWGFGMGTWALYNHSVYLKISANTVKPCKTVLCFLQVHMHINTDMFKCLPRCAPNRQRGTLLGWDRGLGGAALHADVQLNFWGFNFLYREQA